ncbi:MAG: aminotransferase class I/II-fold pyridoxal phosphate-dependent enzyme [Fusobacterium sp.]|uniref:aminotransferase class I/II-fold pyridoxal phosphate-dependent enzyme n=1 Tax=Fusobacterium sp. TaxID=68766 RepID=UPI003FA01247
MKAIILAAGMGSRLKELTNNIPKCMIEVNGESLIKRLLKILIKYKVNDVVLVVGYKSEVLIDYISKLELDIKVTYIYNKEYNTTNNIYSLFLAKPEILKEDILLLESDLIFDEQVIEKLVSSPENNLAVVSPYEHWMDGTCVEIDEKKNITNFIFSSDFNFNFTDKLYKTVNIYKFSLDFMKSYIILLETYLKIKDKKDYYETIFRYLIQIRPKELKALVLENEKWYEIDNKEDLEIAEGLFSFDEKKLKNFQKRYGGYWRYPEVIDFCYLVNPYFPTPKLIDEMKKVFHILLSEYPSGSAVNNLLAAKYFHLQEDKVIVGNGAAELIKETMKIFKGNIGFISPTFEEYPNRYFLDKSVFFEPCNQGFSYTAQDIIDFFEKENIEILVLINPDNPSGNYLSGLEIHELLKWTKKKKINILIDESFLDFSEEEGVSLLNDNLLDEYENLIVVKSISKSYGVPGLRLGILATSKKEFLESIKKNLPIWNINSFAEYYMQIFNKYEKEYKLSLKRIKDERKIFMKELSEIEYLKVFESQANYILIEILGNLEPNKLAEILLNDYNILIKSLSNKKGIKGNYIRVAIRNREENNYCTRALKEIFKRKW